MQKLFAKQIDDFLRKSITAYYSHYHRPQYGGALSGHVTIENLQKYDILAHIKQEVDN